MADDPFKKHLDDALSTPKELTAKELLPAQKDDKALAELEKFLKESGRGVSNDVGGGVNSVQKLVDLLTPELLSRKITAKDGKETHALAYVLSNSDTNDIYKTAALGVIARAKMPQELRRQIVDLPIVDTPETRLTPLAYAVQAQDYAAVKAFMESGATLNNLGTIRGYNISLSAPSARAVAYRNNNLFDFIADSGKPMPKEFASWLVERNKTQPLAPLLSGLNDFTDVSGPRNTKTEAKGHTPYHIAGIVNLELLPQLMAIDGGKGASVKGSYAVAWNSTVRGGNSKFNVKPTATARELEPAATTAELLAIALQRSDNFQPLNQLNGRISAIDKVLGEGNRSGKITSGWYGKVGDFLASNPDFLNNANPSGGNPAGYLMPYFMYERLLDDHNNVLPGKEFDKQLDGAYSIFLKIEKQKDTPEMKRNFMNYALRSVVALGDAELAQTLITKGARDENAPYQPHTLGKLETAIGEAAKRASVQYVENNAPEFAGNSPGGLAETIMRAPAATTEVNPANALTLVRSGSFNADQTKKLYDSIKKTYEELHPGKKLHMTLSAAQTDAFLEFKNPDPNTHDRFGNAELLKHVILDDVLPIQNEANLAKVKKLYDIFKNARSGDPRRGPRIMSEGDQEAIEKWLKKKADSLSTPEGKKPESTSKAPENKPTNPIAVAEVALGALAPGGLPTDFSAQKTRT